MYAKEGRRNSQTKESGVVGKMPTKLETSPVVGSNTPMLEDSPTWKASEKMTKSSDAEYRGSEATKRNPKGSSDGRKGNPSRVTTTDGSSFSHGDTGKA